MTEVLLVGADTVREDLLAYENARRALSAADVSQPYANALAVETVSLGAAVSLLNDLDWYLARAVDDALVRDPSIDPEEYLSRALTEAVRDDRRDPGDTGQHLKIYGVEAGDDSEHESENENGNANESESRSGNRDGNGAGSGREGGDEAEVESPPRLVEPMYAGRVEGSAPEYDLRDVVDTVVVRVASEEAG
jgi:hypothetical protein